MPSEAEGEGDNGVGAMPMFGGGTGGRGRSRISLGSPTSGSSWSCPESRDWVSSSAALSEVGFR